VCVEKPLGGQVSRKAVQWRWEKNFKSNGGGGGGAPAGGEKRQNKGGKTRVVLRNTKRSTTGRESKRVGLGKKKTKNQEHHSEKKGGFGGRVSQHRIGQKRDTTNNGAKGLFGQKKKTVERLGQRDVGKGKKCGAKPGGANVATHAKVF